MPKKLKGGTFWDFSTTILPHNIKKMIGDPLRIFFPEKSLTMPKKLKGGPFSLARYCMLRGKKNFLDQFARPNRSI